jgi:hypothetical protein
MIDIDNELFLRIASWFRLVKSFVCNGCQRQICVGGGLSFLKVDYVKSLKHSGENPESNEQIDRYFREHLRCQICGAREASVAYRTEEELLADQKKRDDQERSRIAREVKDAEDRKYREECAEGKHGFWADDTPRGYSSGGTRAYDPSTGSRYIGAWNPLDGIE